MKGMSSMRRRESKNLNHGRRCFRTAHVYLQLLSINNEYFMKKTYIPLEDHRKNLKRKKSGQKANKCTPQEHQEEDTQKLSSRSDLFWLSYSLRTASETSKTDFPATQGCKPWQGPITPLTMYALRDVGQKAAGDGYRCQNDGKLKLDHINLLAYMLQRRV